MTERKDSIFKVNDDIDLISLLFVTLKNINLLLSVFLVSFLVSFIYYLSSTKIYKSDSLIEIQKQDLGSSANNFGPLMPLTNNSLEAEMEIYKSRDTLEQVIEKFLIKFPEEDPPSISALFNGLSLSARNQSLVQITFSYDDEVYTRILLDLVTDEFINSKTNFKKESTAATRRFISEELPRVRVLLSEAEDNLNAFKLSTDLGCGNLPISFSYTSSASIFFFHTSKTEIYKLGLNSIPGKLGACSVLDGVSKALISGKAFGNFIGLNATKQASDITWWSLFISMGLCI